MAQEGNALPRIIIYATSSTNLGPLLEAGKNGQITHALVGMFHVGFDPSNQPYVHLNNLPPSDPSYDDLWSAVKDLQAAGVVVMASLGGGGVSDYTNLFANYSTFYPMIQQAIQQYNLSGIDLDIEEAVTTADVQKLVGDLRADFPGGLISSAPVASALTGGGTVSPGVDYNQLLGSFDWYNLQFYNGFGSIVASGPKPHYADVVKACGIQHVPKLVAGVLTNDPLTPLAAALRNLGEEYEGFGGVVGWNYLNTPDFSVWAATMWGALRSNAVVVHPS
jgi:hypothetical protein